MVHGDCFSAGCYAMEASSQTRSPDRNAPIEEIWTLMAVTFAAGQPAIEVHALPFRLEEDRLTKRIASKWAGFWTNLKEGYDYFEHHRLPPRITVKNGRYHIHAP